MSKYTAKISWTRDSGSLADYKKYSRVHTWTFDGGFTVPASASPQVVRVPYSSAEAVDPEEAFVASLSSCHMLWFLDLATRRGFITQQYTDEAEGVLARNENGKLAMTEVTLHPKVVFVGEQLPNREELEQLHHTAHEECFIANSVTSKVNVIIDGSEKA